MCDARPFSNVSTASRPANVVMLKGSTLHSLYFRVMRGFQWQQYRLSALSRDGVDRFGGEGISDAGIDRGEDGLCPTGGYESDTPVPSFRRCRRAVVSVDCAHSEEPRVVAER